MQPVPTFSLGNQKVDSRLVNAQTIAAMADCAQRINAPENPAADDWAALSDRVTHANAVSTSDLEQLMALGRACFKYHRKLHDDFKESGYSDPKLKAELAEVHVYQDGYDRVRDAIGRASAATAVAAAVGGTFGPTGLVTTFLAFAKMSNEKLKGLVSTLQGIRDGSSPTLLGNNKVETVHHDEVWPKMIRMLDDAIARGRSGNPTTVTAQYYELTNPQIVGKLAQAAQAGNQVRINVDAGRLVGYSSTRVEVDSMPDKFRTVLQLLQVKGDIGVSIFPVVKALEDPNDLMHRKGLSVGDTFLMTGMNANLGSGENIDAGAAITGPAARQLQQNFVRDVNDSTGASNADVFGSRPLADFKKGNINIGARGLIAMFDCAHGPSPAGTALPRAATYGELEKIAEQYGEKLSNYIDLPLGRNGDEISSEHQVPLNKEGKKRFMALLQRTLDATRTPANLKRLNDIDVSEGKPAGSAMVGIADQPLERQAWFITAVQNAERYIYVPAFVMTRAVASLLVARRDELKEQGRDIDIRVIADPGIYPDGGTPNESGVKFLEDNGIPVRWALLPRSGDHERKVHAKVMLTDKGELVGSTNFSIKGMTDNWEQSTYIEVDPSDPSSVAQQDHARAKFLDLWDNQSFELNSLDKGKQICWRERDSKDYLMQANEARFGVQRSLISAIDAYGAATAGFVLSRADGVADRILELEQQGYDPGSATLKAVQEDMGPKAFYAALEDLPERQSLEGMKPRHRHAS